MDGGYGLWRSFRNGDFEEEDVWGVIKERTESSYKVVNSRDSACSSSTYISTNLPSAARMIPFPRASSSNSQRSSHNSTSQPKIVQQSAPVNIPQWSQIYGKRPKNLSNNESSDDDDDDVVANDGIDSDDEDGYDDEQMPPHEYIARRLARTQISSFSVLEGVGRTLKGRDLSKVRNAVLTKTGFLESP